MQPALAEGVNDIQPSMSNEPTTATIATRFGTDEVELLIGTARPFRHPCRGVPCDCNEESNKEGLLTQHPWGQEGPSGRGRMVPWTPPQAAQKLRTPGLGRWLHSRFRRRRLCGCRPRLPALAALVAMTLDLNGDVL